MNRALEVIDLVETDTDRRSARPLRRDTNLGRAFLHAVDVVPELAAVVDRRHVIPDAERMQTVAIEQCLTGVGTVDVAVQTPFSVDDADLEQHPVVAAVLLQVEPPLLGGAAIGAEDRLPRERLGAGERMGVDEQRIVDTIELDRLADGRRDHVRVADDGGRMIAETIEAIERP
jgi:hypothetical protein